MPEPLGRSADFLLRVKGDSMIDAGILDGDTLVVQRTQDARNGEIVVALVGDDEAADEATVKTFYRENGRDPPAARERRARADLRRPRPDPRQVTGVFRSLWWSSSPPSTGRSTRSSPALARGASLECLVCGEFLLAAGRLALACLGVRLDPLRGPRSARDPS